MRKERRERGERREERREKRGERREGREERERKEDVHLGKNIFHNLMSLCNTPESIPSALKLLDDMKV
jgi:hypothetical protein